MLSNLQLASRNTESCLSLVAMAHMPPRPTTSMVALLQPCAASHGTMIAHARDQMLHLCHVVSGAHSQKVYNEKYVEDKLDQGEPYGRCRWVRDEK